MPEERNPLAIENQVCFALAVASRSVVALYRPILEPLGLTHPQYLVMLALWEESPRSITSIGRTLQLEPATLSPLLKRLEASGYVARRRSESDERVVEISLTDAGTALRAQAEKVPPQIMDTLDMSEEELTRVRDILHTVIAQATRR